MAKKENFEFDAFVPEVRRGRGASSEGSKYDFLKNLKVGSQSKHFPAAEIDIKKLQSSISALNTRVRPEGMHFSVASVDETDPRGVGARVFRDDIIREPRQRKAKATAEDTAPMAEAAE